MHVHPVCNQAREQAGSQVQGEEVVRCRAILAAGRSSCSAGNPTRCTALLVLCNVAERLWRCASGLSKTAMRLPYRRVRICCHACCW
jgi:hypothetical protein